MDFELALANQKIEDLQNALRMQSSTTIQMLSQIQVALEEEDDPEEALRLVKEFLNIE